MPALLFGTTFDTLYPIGTAFDVIADVILRKLAEEVSCSEDSERYTQTVGAIQMLEKLVENGHITPEIARLALRDIWLESGLEVEIPEKVSTSIEMFVQGVMQSYDAALPQALAQTTDNMIRRTFKAEGISIPDTFKDCLLSIEQARTILKDQGLL